MKYILHLILGCFIYHVIVCSIGTFVSWELSYFNISEWKNGTRFFYMVCLFIVGGASLLSAHEGNTEANK